MIGQKSKGPYKYYDKFERFNLHVARESETVCATFHTPSACCKLRRSIKNPYRLEGSLGILRS